MGSLHVWLRNVGLGPALRVEVWANYADLTPGVSVVAKTIPAISPDETQQHTLKVSWAVVEGDPKVPRPDGFPIKGTYLDRSLRREEDYTIIARWND
jgi:hypothetical protein